MQQLYEYVGCFFDFEELYAKIANIPRKPLAKTISNPHVTFVYKPEEIDESLFGSIVKVRIIGYGFNEENEGLHVDVRTDNDALEKMITEIPVPHITLSISENGAAVNTRYLAFYEIEPVELTGFFGGCTFDREVNVGSISSLIITDCERS